MSISNCGHDENNRYSNGKAGDQTGTEWNVCNWYSRPWKCVLRHPDVRVRTMIAQMAKAAAENNRVGYDQNERYTFWQHLKASDYDPAQITVNCEADCSSGVAAIVKATGYRLGIVALQNVSVYLWTGNMRSSLRAAGFEVLTESKYLTSDAYLLAGDILLNDEHHVATNLTNGSKAGAPAPAVAGGKSIDAVAREVIDGKWGNGTDRVSRLKASGYDADAVQSRVNAILKGGISGTKTVDEIAHEVIAGKWGNGASRKKRITSAGYDYAAVQKRVNQILS